MRANEVIRRHIALVIVCAAATAWAAWFAHLGILRLRTFQARGDLACLQQHIWSTANGEPFRYTIARSYSAYRDYWGWTEEQRAAFIYEDRQIGAHFSPIYLVNALIYRVWPSTHSLIVTQAILAGIGGILAFLVARRVVGSDIVGFAITAAYFLYPPLLNQTMRDVHESMWAPPIFLAIILAWLHTRPKLFWVSVGAGLLIKESAGPALAALGLYLVSRRDIRRGIVLAGAASAWFVLSLHVFIPLLSQSGHYYRFSGFLASPLGDGIGPIAKTLLSEPAAAAAHIFSDRNLDYVWRLSESWAFLPFLSGFFWIVFFCGAGLPNLLSGNPTFTGIWSHYEAFTIPVMVVSTALGLRNLANGARWVVTRLHPTLAKCFEGRGRAATLASGLAASLAGGIIVMQAIRGNTETHSWPGAREPKEYSNHGWNLRNGFRRKQMVPDPRIEALPSVIARIEPGASVCATDALTANLAERRWITAFPARCFESDYVLATRTYEVFPWTAEELARLLDGMIASGRLSVVHDDGEVVLLRRTPPGGAGER